MRALISGTRANGPRRRSGELAFELAPDPGLREAVCTTFSPALFFPDESDEGLVALARDLCSLCPVKAACLALALETEGCARPYMRFGIWGGTTPKERYVLYRLKRQTVAAVVMRPGVCGTCRGYTKHRRSGEDACDACRAAVAADSRRRRRANRSVKEAA
ncbi:WhiB family transcriptional regulator [Streptomyces sp. NPDC001262]|uniref:WhiB family transcriptional regulator n=1 Tax=Streptomyces sp. NPDC001262 TaxID=3364552 RepID=UPI0036C6625A